MKEQVAKLKSKEAVDFLRLMNGMQTLGYQAAKMINPDMTEEEFVMRTGPIFHGLVTGEIFVDNRPWEEIRKEINDLTLTV